MTSKELTYIFWAEHFNEKNRSRLSKIKQKVYDWLNGDNFRGFVLDNKIFWIEKTCSIAILPNYIYNYIIKWAKQKGFQYLYTV